MITQNTIIPFMEHNMNIFYQSQNMDLKYLEIGWMVNLLQFVLVILIQEFNLNKYHGEKLFSFLLLYSTLLILYIHNK
jgi:hypothetical protein